MKLSDMLGYADIGQLSRIADTYHCECSGNSKNELIQSILATALRNDVFEERMRDMKLEDLRFLNSLLFDTRESYSLEDLVARVQQSRFGTEPLVEEPPNAAAAAAVKRKRGKKKAEQAPTPVSPREIIARFKHQGWLFNGFSGPGRYLFQVPSDLKARFRDTMRKRFVEQLQYTDEPSVYRDEQGMMLSDMKQFLYYVAQNEVMLSMDGSMYKRSIMQILDRLDVQEQLPGKGEWRFGYGRHFNHYPDRLSLLYDYCCNAGYVQQGGASLTITDKGMERMRESSIQEMADIYHYWLKLYKLPIANLASFVHWIQALSQQWVTVRSLSEALLPFIKSYYYDDETAILEVRIVKMMMHIGLLRIGEHELYGTVIRMTKAGDAILSGKPLEERGLSPY